jgi:protein-L-isoaspartate(D-aspartate) O-methyltransferase
MMTLDDRRRFYAEEIAATANLRSEAVVDALASVPREQFLPPGPWTVRGEADFQSPPRQTADADPRHVYHNLAIAIDPSRQLFNGAPGLLAMAIDTLGVKPGDRALHIGAGTGYYSAVIAQCVGPSGHLLALEVDTALADRARENLAASPWVDVRRGDGNGALDGQFDAILINAGVTHPLESWLGALAVGGRMILPLTVTMSPSIGKGILLLLTKTTDAARLDTRVVTFVAIYSAVGVRDDARATQLGEAMRKNPFPQLKHLRRDAHEPSATCWLHASGCCLSTE